MHKTEYDSTQALICSPTSVEKLSSKLYLLASVELKLTKLIFQIEIDFKCNCILFTFATKFSSIYSQSHTLPSLQPKPTWYFQTLPVINQTNQMLDVYLIFANQTVVARCSKRLVLQIDPNAQPLCDILDLCHDFISSIWD